MIHAVQKCIVVAALFLVACVPMQKVEYSAKPGRVGSPRAELRALIMANTQQGCVSDPEFSETMLVVKYVCNSNTAGSDVLRFDSIANIELESNQRWYRVRVTHSDGSKQFEWLSRNRGDAERIYDSIVAISQPPESDQEAGAGELL